ncbi:MAG: hypothetical protein U0T32_14195 [Chitinophagales bacterium]
MHHIVNKSKIYLESNKSGLYSTHIAGIEQLVARWAHIRHRRTSVRNALLSKIYLQIKVNNIWNRVKADYKRTHMAGMKQLVARWAHIRQRRTSVRIALPSKIYLQIKVNNIWNRVKADYIRTHIAGWSSW